MTTPPAMDRSRSSAARAEVPVPEAEPESEEVVVLPPDPDGIEVHVLQGRVPVADAELWLVDCPKYMDIPLYAFEWFAAGELDLHLEGEGVRYAVDEHGHTRVAVPKNDAVVVAARGELWGYEVVAIPCEAPIVVQMLPDYDLRVRVVDERGLPRFGARVALGTELDGEELLASTLAPDGIARLRHAGYVVDQGGRRSRHEVYLEALAYDVPSLRIDRDSPPTDVVELVAPSRGACRVDVVGPDGSPWNRRVELELALVDEDGEELGPIVRREAVHESALFGDVELGEWIEARAERMRDCFVSRTRVPGPERPDELVVLTIRLGEGAAQLRGRLVDAHGEPLAKASLNVSVEGLAPDSALSTYCVAQTNDAGRFEWKIEPASEDIGPLLVTFHVPDELEDELGDATVELPVGLAPGPHELGDVVFPPAGVLAEGTVFDQAGNPVAGAVVRAEPVEITEDGRSGRVVRRAVARTGADGRFQVLGAFTEPRIELSVGDEDSWRRVAEFPRGARDLVLRHEGSGSIAGRILLSERLLGRGLRLDVEDPILFLGSGSFADTLDAVLDASGGFEQSGLSPGIYDIVVRDDTSRAILWRIPGVEVKSGSVTRDPRLNPLDLRDAVHVVRLRILDGAGDPIPAGVIGTRAVGEALDVLPGKAAFEEGRLELVHAGRGLDIEVAAPGFLAELAQAVTDDRTIVLAPAPVLSFSLPAGVRPPAPEVLVVLLLPADDSIPLGWPESWAVVLDEDGEGALLAPRTGRMRMVVGLMNVEAGDRSAGERMWWIDVAAGPESQTIAIPVDQAELERMLGEFRSER